MSESLLSRANLVSKLLKNKKFRDGYVYEHVRNGVPFQMRALRDEREWTQADLAEAAKKPRSVITRLENPNYGKLTLKTLFEIASAFEVALLVKFVPFSRLLREYEDVSLVGLSAKSVSNEDEIEQLMSWANAESSLSPIVMSAPGTENTASLVLQTRTQPVIARKPFVRAAAAGGNGIVTLTGEDTREAA